MTRSSRVRQSTLLSLKCANIMATLFSSLQFRRFMYCSLTLPSLHVYLFSDQETDHVWSKTAESENAALHRVEWNYRVELIGGARVE